MKHVQVYEGTREEIAAQICEFTLAGRFRAVVIPETESGDMAPDDAASLLLKAAEEYMNLSDQVGSNLLLDASSSHTEFEAEGRQRRRQKDIDALSMTGAPERKKDAWLDYAGKYTEDDDLIKILDAGAGLRDAERNGQC